MKYAILTLLLLLGSNLSAQSGSRSELDALLLRGDFARASSILANTTFELSDPERSLYEAAVRPAPSRAGAMLSVARLYPRHAVADRALAAAAGAILLGHDRGDLVPELQEREPNAQESWNAREDAETELTKLVKELGELLVLRRAHKILDRAAFVDANWMHRAVRVRKMIDKPIRIATRTPVPVPSPLADNLTLRVFRCPHGQSLQEFIRYLTSATSHRVHTLSKGKFGVTLPALEAGEYVFELESSTSGWIVLRTVLVSDLDLILQRIDGAVLAMVERSGKPVVGADVQIGAQRVKTDDRGIAILTADPKVAIQVEAREGEHFARVALESVTAGRIHDGPKCHAMVDRPVYRPGETVQGRLVIRDPNVSTIDGLLGLRGTGSEPRPLRDQTVTLIAWPLSATPVRVVGKTDPDGVLPFTFQVPEASELGAVEMRIYLGEVPVGGTTTERLATCKLFQIAAYRRAAVIAGLGGTTRYEPGGDPIRILLSARLASGAPAAGLRVDVKVHEANCGFAKQSGVLDQRGQLVIPVLTRAARSTIHVKAEVRSPDGRVIRLRHKIEPRIAEPKRYHGLRITVTGPARAGDNLQVRIDGKPGESALVTCARDVPFAVQRLVLDENGTSATTFELPFAAWPSVDVFVATHHQKSTKRIITLPAFGLAALTIATDRKAYTPRQEVTCTLSTTDLDKRPIPARVTVTIVDERVFSIVPDRTPRFRDALEPLVSSTWNCWRAEHGIHSSNPLQVIGLMLGRGRLEFSPVANSMSGGPSSPGFAGAARTTIRADFRPTVLFKADIATDDRGKATIRFRLPDDLTTFRITALAIDGAVGTARALHRIDTRKRLSITQLLPRVLRKGDRARLPVLVDYAESESKRSSVRLADEAGVLTIPTGTTAIDLTRGVSEMDFDIAADRVGVARLIAIVNAGGLQDATVHTRRVLADTISVPVTEILRFSGDRKWQPKTTAANRQLTILGSRAAMLDVCREFLAEYPHGCVEQTLSRILPFFAVARAGGQASALTNQERRRLRAGLRRLRRLRVASDRGFAWWPGGKADDGMSALVLHGLVMAREGGLRPAEHGLQMAFDRGYVFTQARALVAIGGQVGRTRDKPTSAMAIETAELVIAALRFQPDGTPGLRSAVNRLVLANQALPPGMLARAGLALIAAGDRDAARKIHDRLTAGTRVGTENDSWSRFPGEDSAVVAATRLELVLALGVEGKDEAVTNLYTSFVEGGFSSTYGTSCTIAALLRESGGKRRASGKQIVQVRSSDMESRRVELTADNGYRGQVSVSGGSISLSSPDHRELIVFATTTVVQPASTHPGWQSGLTVQRQLCRPGTSEIVRARRGMPIDVVIEVSTRRNVRYVVVSTPLPAGFEVNNPGPELDVFDERVVTTLPVVRVGSRHEVRFTVVPALTGSVSWPPVVARAMYAAGCHGSTAGAVLQILPSSPVPESVPLKPFYQQRNRILDATPPRARTTTEIRNERFDHWESSVRMRTELASLTHAASADLTTEDKSLLAEFEDLLDNLPIAEEMSRLQQLSRRKLPKYGAARGPLLVALYDRILTRCRRVVARLRPRTLQEFISQGSQRDDYLQILKQLGKDGHQQIREFAAAVFASGRPDWIEEFLDYDVESLQDLGMPTELHALLSHESEAVRRLALELLPTSEWRRLPTAVIERVLGDTWDTDDLTRFLTHPLGAARVLMLLKNERFCQEFGDELEDVLPRELALRAPLTCQRICFEASVLATSKWTNRQLEEELRRTIDLGWQEKLLLALSRRGLPRLSRPPESDREHFYNEMLRAGSGERDAALQLRKRIWEHEASQGDLELRPEFVARMFMRDWTPREFREWAKDFDDDRTAWLRAYSDEWRVQFIRSLDEMEWFPLIDLPEAVSPKLRAALWSLALRNDAWFEEVVEVLMRRAEDSAWLRDQIAAVVDPVLRRGMRSMFAEYSHDAVVERLASVKVRHRFGLPR